MLFLWRLTRNGYSWNAVPGTEKRDVGHRALLYRPRATQKTDGRISALAKESLPDKALTVALY